MNDVTDIQLAHRLERALADDLRTNELGIHMECAQGRLVVRGEVASAERRQMVLDVLHEHQPQAQLVDLLTVSADSVAPPESHELIETEEER